MLAAKRRAGRRNGPSERRGIGVVAALLLVALPLGTSRAEPPAAIHIVDEGGLGCPSSEAVARATALALPSVVVTAERRTPGSVAAIVSDLGPAFAVTVEGARREVADPGRSCHERARTAAIIILLALEPPSVSLPPEPPPEASTPDRPDASPRKPPPDPRVQVLLEVAGAAVIAPSQEGPLPTGGGGLRLVAGRHPFSASLGVSALAPVTVTGMGATGTMTRAPFDLSLRAELRRERWALAGEVGLAIDLLAMSRPDQMKGAVDTEAGVRLAAQLRWRAHPRVEPFATVEAYYYPFPQALLVNATDPAGTVPALWFGLGLGASLKIF